MVKNTDGGLRITGEHVAIARLLALRSALRLEIKTGMKLSRRRSPMSILQQEFGIRAKTKTRALEETEALLTTNGIDFNK